MDCCCEKHETWAEWLERDRLDKRLGIGQYAKTDWWALPLGLLIGFAFIAIMFGVFL